MVVMLVAELNVVLSHCENLIKQNAHVKSSAKWYFVLEELPTRFMYCEIYMFMGTPAGQRPKLLRFQHVFHELTTCKEAVMR